jgi:alkylation response protein AidB-like acyl-CoA dehydrogenase
MKLNVGGDIPLLNPRDLNFLLYEWLDTEALCERHRYSEHSKDTFDAVLELAADIALELFAPHNKLADQHEISVAEDGSFDILPEARKALEAICESGLLGSDFDEHLGGMQLPHVMTRAAFVWLQAANVSTSSYVGLTIANAHLLAHYGTAEQVDTWVRPMIEGRYFGTMCLSEPDSGSSLADIGTKAVPQPDGTYRLTGTKMWISGGDHDLTENIVHLVLAKTPGAASGVKGISLFIVPKYLQSQSGVVRNDVALAGFNHKMGNRGTTNIMLSLGDGTYSPDGQPGAVGYLVGEEGAGLAQMFQMMNEARIMVGIGAAALGYTGYLQSLEYARTRVQGRSLDARRGADTAQVPIVRHPDVRRMLLAQKSYVEGGLALALYAARLVDEIATADDDAVRDHASLLLEVLTPIVKSWPSQWCLEANNLAIQIHGGYGYTRDFNVEQLYRDNRHNLIHEGAHAIHGLDLLGRKVTMQDGAGLRALLETIGQTVNRAEATGDTDLVRWSAALQHSGARIAEVTSQLWGSGNPAIAMANSTVYLEGVGHVVAAWIWLEQALVAHGKDGDFYDGKRAAATYFFTYELPKTTAQFDLLESLDRSLTDLSESCL